MIHYIFHGLIGLLFIVFAVMSYKSAKMFWQTRDYAEVCAYIIFMFISGFFAVALFHAVITRNLNL